MSAPLRDLTYVVKSVAFNREIFRALNWYGAFIINPRHKCVN